MREKEPTVAVLEKQERLVIQRKIGIAEMLSSGGARNFFALVEELEDIKDRQRELELKIQRKKQEDTGIGAFDWDSSE